MGSETYIYRESDKQDEKKCMSRLTPQSVVFARLPSEVHAELSYSDKDFRTHPQQWRGSIVLWVGSFHFE